MNELEYTKTLLAKHVAALAALGDTVANVSDYATIREILHNHRDEITEFEATKRCDLEFEPIASKYRAKVSFTVDGPGAGYACDRIPAICNKIESDFEGVEFEVDDDFPSSPLYRFTITITAWNESQANQGIVAFVLRMRQMDFFCKQV